MVNTLHIPDVFNIHRKGTTVHGDEKICSFVTYYKLLYNGQNRVARVNTSKFVTNFQTYICKSFIYIFSLLSVIKEEK